jgi:hypothetical protein
MRNRIGFWLVERSHFWFDLHHRPRTRRIGPRIGYRLQMLAHGVLGNGWRDNAEV